MDLPVDSHVHELRLGKSFDSNSGVAFHSFRYDFKPASVDTSQGARLEVEGHQVTVTVPHVQGAGTSHTVFKGNKRPTQGKECVLIIDHETGTYTLEKLDQNVLLKKTRTEGSSRAHRPATPVDMKKASPSKSKPAKNSPPSMHDSRSITPLPSDTDKGADDIALIGDLSSDSSDEEMVEVPEFFQNGSQTQQAPHTASGGNRHGSQNGFQAQQTQSAVLQQVPHAATVGSLKDDLELSESGSDSD